MDKAKIQEGVKLILEGIGEDIHREGLVETPDRIARMYEELAAGYTDDAAVHLKKRFHVDNNDMVMEKDIPFYSFCEHHMLPFYGTAAVAYIPDGEVVGLSKIARTLEVSLDELGAIALTSTEKIEITSMCSVFAESEVISLIANNKEKVDIADGVCHAIANKAFGLLRRVGMEPDFMMTGGVAKNPGVVRAVEEKIGSSLYICEEPEIVGAAGAALYALEKVL